MSANCDGDLTVLNLKDAEFIEDDFDDEGLVHQSTQTDEEALDAVI